MPAKQVDLPTLRALAVSPVVARPAGLALGHCLEHSKHNLVADLAGHLLQLVEEQVEETMLVAQAELAVEPVGQHVKLALKRKGDETVRSP